MNEALLIAGMALLTFGPRYLPLALAGRVRIPPLLEQALRFVPIAVLSAIIAQTTLVRNGEIDASPGNPYLLAAVAAGVTAYFSRQLFATVAVGLLVYAAARWLL
ncbi:branched-chain amino acid ABC transporter [Marinobacterium nitratireducens]|uniref:Branched-chain amino acid ABC transporter n=1 Tax=Marinobacterium nitratireducens TaxID=518897 RepID=A0A918DSP3_9GAMM|nr:AzlD domain-containing protein [Marinobacterium nitratireducens]GGO81268.1 branched-chain amino acid ABC transporter [Marinobacterium nitratireducens]